MMDLRNVIGLGVAGNFPGDPEQAGEAHNDRSIRREGAMQIRKLIANGRVSEAPDTCLLRQRVE